MYPLYTFVCALAAVSGVVGSELGLEPRADQQVKTLTKKQVVKYTVTKDHKPVVTSRTITLRTTSTVDADLHTTSWTRHYTTTVNKKPVVATKTIRKTITDLARPTVHEEVVAAHGDLETTSWTRHYTTTVDKKRVVATKTVRKTYTAAAEPTVRENVAASRATKTLDIVSTATVKAKTTSKGKVKTVTTTERQTNHKTITTNLSTSTSHIRVVSTTPAKTTSTKPSATSKSSAKAVAKPTAGNSSDDDDDDDDDDDGPRIGNVGSFKASASIKSTQPLKLLGTLSKVLTLYNNGAKGLTGSFGDSFGTGGVNVGWQASGYLAQGGCDSALNKAIPDCYSLTLSGDPDKNLAPGYSGSQARQRTEIYVQGVTDESTWEYTWRTYLDSTVTTGQFFHVFQLLTRGEVSGPVVYLDAARGNVTLRDVARCSSGCAAVPIESFADRVIQHSMTVKFGNNGKMVYTADDYTTGGNLISYQANGWMGNVSTSLKFGLYRKAVDGIGQTSAYVGQFTAKQM